jgi:hypothetical protein
MREREGRACERVWGMSEREKGGEFVKERER